MDLFVYLYGVTTVDAIAAPVYDVRNDTISSVRENEVHLPELCLISLTVDYIGVPNMYCPL